MDTFHRTDDEMLALMTDAFSTVADLCGALGPGDWDLPTDCPAWTVRDQLAHLTAFEARMTGAPDPPPIDRARFPHVRNDFQDATEVGVEARRHLTGAQILDEFRDATAKRVVQLRALDAAAWDAPVATPIGERPQRGMLGIRVLDLHYHEQDIRRATGRPGNLDGAVTRYCVERFAALAMPFIVGKKAGAPEGATVRFEIDGIAGATFTVGVRDGVGALVDGDGTATTTFAMDVETFLCLVGGRWTADRARSEGRLKIDGDVALAAKILDQIVVVP